MSTQMLIRIDPELKKKLERLARMEGKSASGLAREAISSYVSERDIGAYIDDLWDRMGRKFRAKGIKQSDIPKIIKDVRARKRHESRH